MPQTKLYILSKLALLIFLTWIIACNNKQTNIKLETTNSVETKTSLTLEDFKKGKSYDLYKAILTFGEPSKNKDFTLGIRMHQFRREILNFYNKDQIESKSIRMKELTWAPDTINFVTIWYEINDSITKPIHIRFWDVNTYY